MTSIYTYIHTIGTDIGEVFVSSVYDVPCMYVRVFDIRDGMLAGSYVCTYGVLLGIRLTEAKNCFFERWLVRRKRLLYSSILNILVSSTEIKREASGVRRTE